MYVAGMWRHVDMIWICLLLKKWYENIEKMFHHTGIRNWYSEAYKCFYSFLLLLYIFWLKMLSKNAVWFDIFLSNKFRLFQSPVLIWAMRVFFLNCKRETTLHWNVNSKIHLYCYLWVLLILQCRQSWAKTSNSQSDRKSDLVNKKCKCKKNNNNNNTFKSMVAARKV